MRPSVEHERREQLEQAAARVIARRGYEAATLREVAREAGLSTGAIAYYYGGKEVLFAATLAAASRAFHERMAAAVERATGPRAKLLAMARAAAPDTAEARRAHALWIDYWAQAARDPRIAKLNTRIYDRWRNEMAELVRRGQQARTFSPEVDPAAFARGYAAVIDGLATHAVLHPDVGPDEMRAACERYLDAVLRVS